MSGTGVETVATRVETARKTYGSEPAVVVARDDVTVGVAVPARLLTTYFLVAVAVGVLAAIGPARRAGRINLLTDVTTE